MNKYELESRLIEFSVSTIKLSRKMNRSYVAKHLSSQLICSGTSVSLNYGEAMSGESIRDFIHNMKIILKELRESHICLKIVERANLCSDLISLNRVKKGDNELISIIVASINTAAKRNK